MLRLANWFLNCATSALSNMFSLATSGAAGLAGAAAWLGAGAGVGMETARAGAGAAGAAAASGAGNAAGATEAGDGACTTSAAAGSTRGAGGATGSLGGAGAAAAAASCLAGGAADSAGGAGGAAAAGVAAVSGTAGTGGASESGFGRRVRRSTIRSALQHSAKRLGSGSPFTVSTSSPGWTSLSAVVVEALLCLSTMPSGITLATAVRVGSRSQGSRLTPSLSAGLDLSKTTSKVRPAVRGDEGASGAGPACHRRSVSRTRFEDFSFASVC
mmetsp:Transcript_125152/g.216836  ORF Transcript_125152/g.216836 Transcript_125152/m.216836 type:complete len:272 (+) Transcript_125152:414-1229(+)